MSEELTEEVVQQVAEALDMLGGAMSDDELRARTARNIDRLGIPRGSNIEYRWDGSGQCIVCNACACRIGTSPFDRETHTAWHASLAEPRPAPPTPGDPL